MIDKVYVVCQNDFPERAFSFKVAAEEYLTVKKEEERLRQMEKQPYFGRMIYWHLREVPYDCS